MPGTFKGSGGGPRRCLEAVCRKRVTHPGAAPIQLHGGKLGNAWEVHQLGVLALGGGSPGSESWAGWSPAVGVSAEVEPAGAAICHPFLESHHQSLES